MELLDQAITDGANEQAVSIQRIVMIDYVEKDYIENGYMQKLVMEMIDHGENGVYDYDVTHNYIVD